MWNCCAFILAILGTLQNILEDILNSYIFLRNKDIIFDEIQNIPELFSYIQIHIDSNNRKGQFILTGSQNFSLIEKISQSLAGRTYIYKLLPLTLSELKKAKYLVNDYKEHVFKGFYPEVYYENQDVRKWAESYIETYVEKGHC